MAKIVGIGKKNEELLSLVFEDGCFSPSESELGKEHEKLVEEIAKLNLSDEETIVGYCAWPNTPLKADWIIYKVFDGNPIEVKYIGCERPEPPRDPDDTPENRALPWDDPRKVRIRY